MPNDQTQSQIRRSKIIIRKTLSGQAPSTGGGPIHGAGLRDTAGPDASGRSVVCQHGGGATRCWISSGRGAGAPGPCYLVGMAKRYDALRPRTIETIRRNASALGARKGVVTNTAASWSGWKDQPLARELPP